jgi:hypothetical protein
MRRTHRIAAMAAICILLSASFVSAGPQRGGGGGGERRAQPREAVRPAPPPGGGGAVAVHGGASPYYAARGSYVFVGGYFYDPFYGPYPWWPAAAYPYAYYPGWYDPWPWAYLATPREAAVRGRLLRRSGR